MKMRFKGYLCIGFVCIFYWILDSVWAYLSFEINLKKLIFSEPASYLDTFLLKVSPYQMVSRVMVVFLFIVTGLLIIEFLIKQQSAEKERKETHDTLLTVLNSIDATIYVSDMQTHEILFMNQCMRDNFGNLIGKTCYEVLYNNNKACEHCRNHQLLDESGNPAGVMVGEGCNPVTGAWYVYADRAIKWVDGRIVHLQIATDITQLKDLQEKQNTTEAQLQLAQKMESIGTLAGGIAHDFNNILASILGFTELALDDVRKGTIIEDNLQEVLTAGNRAKELVKQILAFARQSDEKLKPIQVSIIVKEVLKFIRSSIPTTIEITQEIRSNSLINANSTQVHQVVMNLCTNAAFAMEEKGGVLDVCVKDVSINTDQDTENLQLPPGNYIEVKITDTGVGIPPDILGSIFEPYFTTKGPGEGTGLGLAMVHGIVESYGGKSFVNSTMGKGTTFTVYLPITKKRNTEHSDAVGELPLGNERILFVDDEQKLAKAGGQILEKLGYSVTIRTDSLEALKLLESSPNDFDLVVTDMTMPTMTGDVLATKLIHFRPDIPIILCTGYSKKISEEKAAEIGIKAFAYKPLNKTDLAKTVRNVLDENRRSLN